MPTERVVASTSSCSGRCATSCPYRSIASGGAGAAADFPPAVEAGADAVLAASIFHFGEVSVGDVKAGVARAGHRALSAPRAGVGRGLPIAAS